MYGLALGYEDLNDHEELRRDPLLGVLAEKADPAGASRARARDQGKALAGKSTLNRLELTGAEVKEKERYKKITLDFTAVDRLLGEIFIQAQGEPPKQIVLDLDSTDDPLHGKQEGRFFPLRPDRHLEQNVAATSVPSFLPSSVGLSQSRQIISILLAIFGTHKLCAEPIDRFLDISPIAHPLAVVQALFPDMVGRSPFLVAIRFGLEAAACVLVQVLQISASMGFSLRLAVRRSPYLVTIRPVRKGKAS